ncbi:uncharacterized protein LOC130806400 [Amaranthus tricolor]|uniref:uncharacterized protein LOC130806400 n=1 Tax=Amaranthus tricolor TaxID=29722 RepID=UPI002582828A|nr:uncharacterized protein LOC130806400 [Amaranthus tricolor]
MVGLTQTQLPPSIDHINQLPINCSTPYMSSTSRPMLNFFYSAPTSPHSPKFHSSLFDDVNDDNHDSEHMSLLDHDRHQEAKIGMNDDEKDDFEFDFSGQLDLMVRPSLSSADELFDGGKIRPLKLKLTPTVVPKSKKVMSPKHRKMGSDLGPDRDPFKDVIRNNESKQRGRGRGGNGINRKGMSRSLSPLRVSEFALLGNQDQQNLNGPSNSNGLFGSRKWKLKDLFLFRSASEGHNKDSQSFSKRWSFRSSSMVSGSGSGSGSESASVSKRRGGVSVHEMHYASKRAVSEEMKKKTTLPYKHGLLACLGFSPVLPQFSYAFPNTPPS